MTKITVGGERDELLCYMGRSGKASRGHRKKEVPGQEPISAEWMTREPLRGFLHPQAQGD